MCVLNVARLLRMAEGLTAGFGRYWRQAFAVGAAEVQKLRHDPFELFTRAIQPMLWLVLFGEVMQRAQGLSSGSMPYLDFLSAGILSQSVLFVAIFYGIAAIWERDLGILHRYLVSPAPRSALVLGKAASAGVRGLSQAIVVYLLALVLHVGVSLDPLHLLGMVALIILGAGLFSTLSLIIACIVRTRERFMGIGQVITMPIFFASNAIYPIDIMPRWLQVVARGNPLTYEVDALRALMISGGVSVFGIGVDFAVLLAGSVVLLAIAAHQYGRMGE
jgi:ABC-2 type transport system permease protein